LLGALSPERIAGWLRIADLFVLPSSYEGMPIALLEALATGLPVVVTDVGEVRLVVRDGVNGFISTAQTADAFADACKAALRSIDALRGGACLRAVAPYTPERVLTQVYENHRRQAADVMGARA
jgi:glycosyltransferase involved in cell wall biosynthesis